MNDPETSVQKLKTLVNDFRNARDWAQYNDPKNLAEALSIEAGELLECFLWKDKKTIANRFASDAVFKERVAEELADVAIYTLHMANDTGIDLAGAVQDKMRKNEIKYPVEDWKGRPTKSI